MRQKPIDHDEAFHEAFGRALKVLRAERGLERKELAALAGLSYPYLSEIESGKKRPSSRAVLALADALGVPAHQLWEMAEGLRLRAEEIEPRGGRAGRSFFHSADMAPAAPAVAASMAAPAPEPAGSEQDLLDELIETAAGLSERDLHHLVELARRLAR